MSDTLSAQRRHYSRPSPNSPQTIFWRKETFANCSHAPIPLLSYTNRAKRQLCSRQVFRLPNQVIRSHEALLGLGRRVLLCPLAGGLDGGLLVLFPGLGYFCSEGVVWVRRAEEGLDGEKDRADLKCGGPVVYTNHVSMKRAESIDLFFLLFL